MRVDNCAPSLIWISMRMMAKPSSVLRVLRPSTEDGFAIIRIEVRIQDSAQLNNLMNKLHQISGVLKVNRPVG